MRPGPVVLAALRAALPGTAVVSVVPDVDHRTFPMVSIRRDGGTRLSGAPRRLSHPVLEIVAVSADGPVAAEELYEKALDALYDALPRFQETRGATQVESKYPDTWSVEGQFRLGMKRP